MNLNDSLVFLTPDKHNSLTSELKSALQARNILSVKTKKKLVEALDEVIESKLETKRDQLRQKAINELFETEKSYVQILEIIINYFMKPLEKLLSIENYKNLFGNLMQIYNINKLIIDELNLTVDHLSVFTKLAPYFKLYSVYAYEYKKVLSTLQNLQSSNKEFCKFLETQESLDEVSNKLSALLIAPIQRIPRYKLLFEKILSYTLPNHSDHPKLINLLNAIGNIAMHINNLVDEQENSQRLIEIQRCLQNRKPNIVKPGRKIIKGGLVKRISQENFHGGVRYLLLMNDIILCCKLTKQKWDSPNSLQCCCILPLHKCKVSEIASKGIFTISCLDEALIFYCESTSEVNEWIEAIDEAITDVQNCRKTLRKASSSKKPIRGHRAAAKFEKMNEISPLLRKRKNHFLNNERISVIKEEEFCNFDQNKRTSIAGSISSLLSIKSKHDKNDKIDNFGLTINNHQNNNRLVNRLRDYITRTAFTLKDRFF